MIRALLGLPSGALGTCHEKSMSWVTSQKKAVENSGYIISETILTLKSSLTFKTLCRCMFPHEFHRESTKLRHFCLMYTSWRLILTMLNLLQFVVVLSLNSPSFVHHSSFQNFGT